MKLWRYSSLVILMAALLAGSASGQYFGGGENDTRTTLTIRPDGSCALTNETVMPRKALEMQVATWARYANRAEAPDSENEDASPAPAQAAKPEQKPLTNEELASKYREMHQQQSSFGGNARLELDKVEVSTNSVRLLARQTFASLKDLLSENVYFWGPSLLMFENARFETDTNSNLRITFTPSREAARYTKDMSRAWKSMKMKFQWKLILPGKVLSSGLPGTEANQTWFELDTEKPDALDAAFKLVGTPLVITAELGGLKLDQPLESRKLIRAGRSQSTEEPDVPITDAGPGYQAEPVSLAISTVHYFPEGKARLKDQPQAGRYGSEAPGTTVSAKLFPPKGRIIRSVSELRVKKAKDDQGRAIPTGTEGSDETQSYGQVNYGGDDQEKSGPARVELRLGLPAPDARSIDQLEAEGVALTIGGWKELVLTNVQADTNNPIDLGELVPGAKLIIKKVSGKRPQTSVEVQVEGTAAVNQIEVKIKRTSRQGGSSNVSNQRSKTSGKQVTRNLTVQLYEYEPGEAGKSSPPTLLVRFPQDVKRERVQFKLSGLDLL